MFHSIGTFVARRWLLLLAVWIVGLLVVGRAAPPLDDVVKDGEFAFLPDDSPSREAERQFKQAFPNDLLDSTIVIVVRRESRPEGLFEEDLNFIDDGLDEDDPDRQFELKERIEQIARAEGGLALAEDGSDDYAGSGDDEGKTSVIAQVVTYRDKTIGPLLISDDNKAALIFVALTTEFLESRNAETIARIEDLLFHDAEFLRHKPPGLDLQLSGDATVGRDMLRAARNSAKATEHLTVVLVVILLILIYRAPLLALIPLATVFVAVKITINALILMAQANWIVLFQGAQTYVTVLLYGAGVDYCLFLIARYKEELDAGNSFEDAVAGALGKVGAAVTASAGTVICGIGMMIFAEFGKFHQAGIAISFGLVVVLLAALSFMPSLLRLHGRWAFWPQMRTERVAGGSGWISPESLLGRIAAQGVLQNTWERVGQILLARPGRIWLASIALMLPFALVGIAYYSQLSYGLLSDLPQDAPSVVGAKAVQQHFPAGATGQITVLLRNDEIDFSKNFGDDAGLPVIHELTEKLRSRRDELQLAEIRSVSHPTGGDRSLESYGNPARRRIATNRSVEYYVAAGDDALRDHVTRIDLMAQLDPFSRDSISHLNRLQEEIQTMLPDDFHRETTLLIKGSTASIRDLKAVTDRDQVRIDLLVVGGVFTILVVLLGRPAVCLYLIATVLFSYLATLGVTYLFFWALDPGEFAGLDWKVPMFLFTILIAVGEDYNIFLMTRIEEEQQNYGRIAGVTEALAKTGKIISSCGIIMAGTFASLMAGSLMGMIQLGFALAFGVLLDTFVVRPVLVPAYLVLLYSGRFGRASRWLGAAQPAAEPEPTVAAETSPLSD